MTPEQRAQAVDFMDGPVLLREAAAMLGVPFADFAADWAKGHADAEQGKDTPEAAWYLDCRAARGRCISTIRAEARVTAGSRESADLLRLVEHLTSEAEPLADDGGDDPRGTGLLRIVDMIDDPSTLPAERKRMQAAYAKSSAASRELLRELTARDSRIRDERGGARQPT